MDAEKLFILAAWIVFIGSVVYLAALIRKIAQSINRRDDYRHAKRPLDPP